MHKIYLSLLISSLCYAQSVNFDEILEQTLKNSKDLQEQKLNIDTTKYQLAVMVPFGYRTNPQPIKFRLSPKEVVAYI